MFESMYTLERMSRDIQNDRVREAKNQRRVNEALHKLTQPSRADVREMRSQSAAQAKSVAPRLLQMLGR